MACAIRLILMHKLEYWIPMEIEDDNYTLCIKDLHVYFNLISGQVRAVNGLNLYVRPGVVAIQQAVSEFSGGKVAILISRTPFRCPAAPYEAAFLLDWMFRKRGIRERVEMAFYTPEKQPMPVAVAIVGV